MVVRLLAILSASVGVVIGVLCWLVVAMVFDGRGPPGGSPGWLIVLGPFAVLGPCVAGLLRRGHGLLALWLAALSPIISIDMSAFAFALAVAVTAPASAIAPLHKELALAVIVCSPLVFWCALGLRVVRSRWMADDDLPLAALLLSRAPPRSPAAPPGPRRPAPRRPTSARGTRAG